MKKEAGIHFYINIANFNEVVENEEERGGVNHSVHALDTLFSSVAEYGKRIYPKLFVVEKITGSRLHLFVYGENTESCEAVLDIVAFASTASELMISDIGKYKSLKPFVLQAGACNGDFYEFEFAKESYEEMTTIGFACNYAAKLQALASLSCLAISESMYNYLKPEDRSIFIPKSDQLIHKYEQSRYFEARMQYLQAGMEEREVLRTIRDYANKRNLTNMSFQEVTRSLTLEKLSVSNGRKVKGIPMFADVRGFTAQFESDDSNLELMAQKTKGILEEMYDVTTKNRGIHVQFQGDREFSLYHDIGETKCFKDAVLAGMRMIDAVKPFAVHIGVGEAYGRMFAVRIGARGEKDNLLLGRVVNDADRLEDACAEEDQLVISAEVFEGLKEQDNFLAGQFVQKEDGSYATTIGYETYKNAVVYENQHKQTKRNQYNGAWRR